MTSERAGKCSGAGLSSWGTLASGPPALLQAPPAGRRNALLPPLADCPENSCRGQGGGGTEGGGREERRQRPCGSGSVEQRLAAWLGRRGADRMRGQKIEGRGLRGAEG